MSRATQREKLIEALAEPHRELFMRNAFFRQGMELLATMLPAMVDGLATAAAESQARAEELKRQLERMPMPNLGAAMWSDQVEAENQLAQDQAHFDFQQGDPPPGATI